MQIGLINIEPKIFNTAYMQLAAYHRAQGDEVEWWSPLTDPQFDHVFCSSLFDYTDKSEVPARAICGGTGFDISSRLSIDIEKCELDYNMYPKCDRSFLWFSRGCNRNCPWCVVPEKEGKIHPVEAKNLNRGSKYVVVCDNNFFANPLWEEAIEYLRWLQMPVDFQGIDVRTITNFQAWYLSQLRHHKQIKFAWDNATECGHEVWTDRKKQTPTAERQILAGIKRLTKYISPYRLMCYVLIGYWQGTEEADLYRVMKLKELGISPFVMPYDKKDLYQKAFARWVNHKAIFKSVKWEDYRGRVYAQEAAGTGWSN